MTPEQEEKFFSDRRAFADYSRDINEMIQRSIQAEEQLLYGVACAYFPAPIHPLDIGRFTLVHQESIGDRYDVMIDGEPVGMIVRIFGYDNPFGRQPFEGIKIEFHPGPIRF